MKQAFISYARRDREFAEKLRDDLEFRGLSTWIDLEDIPAASQWATKIEQAILECPYFLLLLSPHSVSSEYVRREYQFAVLHSKTVIPVVLTDCEIPQDIAPIQYVDMQNYETGLIRLLAVFPRAAYIADKSVHQVLTSLKSSNRGVQLGALGLVAAGRIHEALDGVIELLKDADSEVRARAAWTLDQLHDTESIPFLVEAVHDPSHEVRADAGWALVHFGEEVVPYMVTILCNEQNWNVRETAY
jgi:hypothetical protein